MGFLSWRGMRPTRIATACALTVCIGGFFVRANGQAEVGPVALPGAASGTQENAPPSAQSLPPTASTNAALHEMITGVADSMQSAGIKRVAVIGGNWPITGQNALEDWLVAQVKSELGQAPYTFEVVQEKQLTGVRNYKGPILDLTDLDAVVSASVEPGVKGICFTLNAVTSGGPQGVSAELSLVSRQIPLKDELAALLPAEWKQELAEGLAGDNTVPNAGNGGLSLPRCTNCGDPKYSDVARELKLTGVVVIMATVGADAVPRDVRLVKGFGFGFDQAAIEAVSHWDFRPARDRKGNPTAAIVTIEVTFRLL